MDADMLLTIVAALAFAALLIVWGLAPSRPEPVSVKVSALLKRAV